MKPIILVIVAVLNLNVAVAQHQGHTRPTEMSMPEMTSAYSLSLPMNRNGSGTAWAPDESPMFGYMKPMGRWNIMFHGSLFLRYNWQNLNNEDKRGSQSKFDSPNWGMMMLQYQSGKDGLWSIHSMFSLDRLTVGGNGYPLVFQSGETWNDEPLIDRQHPHDLFAELSLGYSRRLNNHMDVYVYVGYPGEPALGPTVFMHRISALNNPDAPLAHHWQDATHISFGVGTLGLRYKIAKIEASVFTGREPDEIRYDFDKPRFDSYSYRISANPTSQWSLQFSQGFLQSPEQLEPDVDVTRTTASVMHSQQLKAESFIATSLVYGLNSKSNIHENSVLLESNYEFKKFALYGRYEWVQKTAEELVLPQYNEEKFDINGITLGANYKIVSKFNMNLRLGMQGSVFLSPVNLETIYGKIPLSAEVYLRVGPSRMEHLSHHH